MSTARTPSSSNARASWTTAALAFIAPLVAGSIAAWGFASSLHNRNFLWYTGRALGIAGYVALFGLVTLGLLIRHPWSLKHRFLHAETRLKAHATLGIATVVLIVGHLVFLASDRYAGVGWIGALIPGHAHYRPVAVGLGVAAFETMIAIALTARFAGRRGAKHWRLIHRLATLTFVTTWFHGVLAGTDTAALRVLYVATGSIVAVLVGSRLVIRLTHSAQHADSPSVAPPVDDELPALEHAR